MKKRTLTLTMALCTAIVITSPVFGAINLGVNAPRGPLKAHAKWDELARYLSGKTGEKVNIVPLGPKKTFKAAGEKALDFALVNPLNTYSLVVAFGARTLATVNLKGNGEHLGGVILASLDSGIHQLEDLKGKKVMAFKIGNSAAAYAFQTKYLLDKGIDPSKDFASFRSAKRQDEIVLAVKNDLIDAGFVKTGLIESMVKEGKVSLDDFTVLDNKKSEAYPRVYSTYLYPGWTLSSLSHVDPLLSNTVRDAVLELNPETPAARNAHLLGFVPPADFTTVSELMHHLKMPPFNQ